MTAALKFKYHKPESMTSYFQNHKSFDKKSVSNPIFEMNRILIFSMTWVERRSIWIHVLNISLSQWTSHETYICDYNKRVFKASLYL